MSCDWEFTPKITQLERSAYSDLADLNEPGEGVSHHSPKCHREESPTRRQGQIGLSALVFKKSRVRRGTGNGEANFDFFGYFVRIFPRLDAVFAAINGKGRTYD